MDPVNQRKSLLVEPQFQISFIKFILIVALSITVIYLGAVEYFFWSFKIKGLELGLSENHVFFSFLSDQQENMRWFISITSLISLSFLFGYGLFMSNKIVGPIFKLKKYLQEYQQNQNIKPIQFRQNDYFANLAAEVNQVLSKNSKKRTTP